MVSVSQEDKQEIEAEMKARNVDIGRVLEKARTAKNRSYSDCARVIGTTRQRYAALERGASFVNAVEIVRLARYLDIPLDAFGFAEAEAEGPVREVPVTILPGETVRVVIRTGAEETTQGDTRAEIDPAE